MKIKYILILASMLFLYINCSENKQILVLENITIIDGTGNLPEPSSSILIKGDKIFHIGKKGEFKYPKDAKVLRLNNKFVISGLIEMHAHMYGKKVLRQQAKTGVDYIKLYTHLTPDLVKAAIDESHSSGLEVLGHLGKTS